MTTALAVHRTISATAAEVANGLARQRGLVTPDAAPFFESVNRTRGRKLSISYDQSFLVGRDPEWIEAMRVAAVEATTQALRTHSDLFAGLVMGTARQGVNYFTGRKVTGSRPRNRNHGRPRGRGR